MNWIFLQTLRGSFSAVSTPIFASKYSLESSWRDLQDLHTFAPLRSQNFSQKSSTFFREWKNEFLPEFIYFLKWFLEVNLNFRDEVENPLVFVWKQQVFRICCCVEHVQLLIRRNRCRSYAYIYFRKLLEVPGIPSHPGRLASSIVGRQQQGPLGDAYFSGMCSLGLC